MGVDLDQLRRTGGIVGGLIDAAAGSQLQGRRVDLLLYFGQRRQQIGRGIRIDANCVHGKVPILITVSNIWFTVVTTRAAAS